MTEKVLHVEAVIKIYFTREYSRFKNIWGNRELSQSKIKKLTNDIVNGLDMLRYCPIIVDDQMNVIDGQHRLWVAKQLKSNIWYVIADKKNLHEIAKINSAVERWKVKDFINCYCTLANENYKTLEAFMSKNNVNATIAINLLAAGVINTNSGTAATSKETFEAGQFKVKFEKDANELMALVSKFHGYKGYNSRSFIEAIQRIKRANKCDMDRLIENFQTNMKIMDGALSVKQIIVKLEEIYNHKKSIRVQIC